LRLNAAFNHDELGCGVSPELFLTQTWSIQWEQAKTTGQFKSAPQATGEDSPAQVPTISSLMAFDGPAPELVNGRLAMLGFFSALGAEVASGEGVLMQLKDAPGAVLATFALIAAATFIPLFQGISPESRAMGPLNADAERSNGRAAMIGLVALVAVELFKGGKALF
jgi:hypothetical protein